MSGPDHLHIPHLLMHERRFVLHPLADLAPEIEHPVLYQTIREAPRGAGRRAPGTDGGPAPPLVRALAAPSVVDERFREQALEHLDALHNLAVYLTRNGSEAQDLVQETYVRAMRFLASLRAGNPSSRLVVSNLEKHFSHLLRLREREAAISENGVPEGEAPMFHDAPGEEQRAVGCAPGSGAGADVFARKSSRHPSCSPRWKASRSRTSRVSWIARWGR